jgi:hypothetical protein
MPSVGSIRNILLFAWHIIKVLVFILTYCFFALYLGFPSLMPVFNERLHVNSVPCQQKMVHCDSVAERDSHNVWKLRAMI